MKRDPALIHLSHDHQHALAVAYELRHADDSKHATARKRLLDFMASEGDRHLEIEERILLPFIADEIPPGDPVVKRVLSEHERLRSKARDLSTTEAPTTDQLRALGDLLHDHVRFEERDLFPRIEKSLTAAKLLELGVLLEDADDQFA